MADRVEELRGIVARGYCHKANSHKVLDGDLLEAIVHELLWANQAAAAQAALALPAEPPQAWLYAIEDSAGAWKDGEQCVFGDKASAQDEVDLLNDGRAHGDDLEYRIVPLYRVLAYVLPLVKPQDELRCPVTVNKAGEHIRCEFHPKRSGASATPAPSERVEQCACYTELCKPGSNELIRIPCLFREGHGVPHSFDPIRASGIPPSPCVKESAREICLKFKCSHYVPGDYGLGGQDEPDERALKAITYALSVGTPRPFLVRERGENEIA